MARPTRVTPHGHRYCSRSPPRAREAAPWHRSNGSASAHGFPAQKFMDWSPNRDTCGYLGRPRTGISGNGRPPARWRACTAPVCKEPLYGGERGCLESSVTPVQVPCHHHHHLLRLSEGPRLRQPPQQVTAWQRGGPGSWKSAPACSERNRAGGERRTGRWRMHCVCVSVVSPPGDLAVAVPMLALRTPGRR